MDRGDDLSPWSPPPPRRPAPLRASTPVEGGWSEQVVRSRWRWVVVAVVVGVLGATAWLVARRGVRSWWWDVVASRPVEADEQTELDACGEARWALLVKVLATDAPTACGEPWVLAGLGGYARGADHAAWLAERVVSPSSPDGARLRAALALSIAGRVPPVEAAWLRTRVPPERAAAMREVLADESLAVHLGPAGVALGVAERAARGEVTAEGALPSLRWLAAVDEPEAAEAVARAAGALTGVEESTVAELGARRRQGRPVAGSEAPGRDALARAACPPDCAAAMVAAVEAQARREQRERAGPEGDEPAEDAALDGFLGSLGWSVGERRAVDGQLRALRAWLDQHPERLRSLWSRPARGPIHRLGWDGGGPPFLSAVVVDRLTPAAPETFRADRADAVWLLTADGWAARTCAVVGLEPPATDWPAPAVWGRAAAEAGAAGVAHALDPSLPEPTGGPGDPVGRSIGASLRAPATLAGAEAERSRTVQGFCAP
jgi:hypothetical protein